MNGSKGYSDPCQSSQHTPSNVSNVNSNVFMAQSQNSLSNYSIGNHLDKFSFSKTQKIDLKDKSILKCEDGRTARDIYNDNVKNSQDIKLKSAKSIKKGTSKRSRGS
jgi:hypothetical protein